MAIQIKHAFVSLKGDGTDATQVQPSHWNASHSLTMATQALIGRISAGAGAAEEIPITTTIANALNSADGKAFLAALGLGAFSTGDIKPSFNPTVDAGWVLSNNGSIGDATSGATNRANADTQNLYVLLWNNLSQTGAPVAGGRGASALADFNAHKPMNLPWTPGRALIGAGGGGSLTTRTLGEYGGAETHILSIGELAAHRHAASIWDPTHTHGHNLAQLVSSSTGGGSFQICGYAGGTISANATGVRVNSDGGLDTTYIAGSNTPHNNMMPFLPVHMWIKL